MHRPAGQEGRPRAGQCNRRSAALVRRRLRTALSVLIFARGLAASGASSRPCRLGQYDQSSLSRRGVEGESHSDRDGSRESDKAEADARFRVELEVLRPESRTMNFVLPALRSFASFALSESLLEGAIR